MTALCHGGFPQCWGSVLRGGGFWGKSFSSLGLAAFFVPCRGCHHCRMLLGLHQLLPLPGGVTAGGIW